MITSDEERRTKDEQEETQKAEGQPGSNNPSAYCNHSLTCSNVRLLQVK